jgi:hypothetical protein
MWKNKDGQNVPDATTDAASVAVDAPISSAAPAAPTPHSPFAVDEYSGRGGSYVVDAETQTRKPNPASS